MKKLLLFGFDSLLNVLALETAVSPLGVELVPVARKDYNKPLAVLAGMDTAPGPMADYAGGPLGGRMMVLCGLEKQLDTLLPVLARSGAGPECLKAVLTPHNRNWSGVMLWAELQKEHRAFQKGGRQ
ncbi:DUF3783 domain-containing protein [Dysosmobacter sp. Sow4_B12]|uniref:DUF3783 domain-containing protein n=1 Tax=Dysosmobacter sp. Sow4_B12 TaxID=3438777 RepID=UPI003F90B693